MMPALTMTSTPVTAVLAPSTTAVAEMQHQCPAMSTVATSVALVAVVVVAAT